MLKKLATYEKVKIIAMESIKFLSFPKLITSVIVVSSFLPVVEIVFVIPLVLMLLLLFVRKSIPLALYKFITVIIFVISLNIFLNFLFNKDYLFFNSIVSLLTYSSVLVFFFPFYFKIDKEFIIWSIKFLIFFSLFQAILSFYQFFVKYKGLSYDAAVGTLGFPGAHEFSMKIILPCVLSFTFYLVEKRLMYIFFGLILFASYVITFFNASFLALGLTFLIILLVYFFDFKGLLFERKKKIVILLLVILVFICFLGFFSDYVNSTYSYSQINKLVYKIRNTEQYEEGIKFDGYYNTFKVLWGGNFFNQIIGVGLGNYSSRAALYLSGEYSERASKILPISKSVYYKKYIFSLWNKELFEANPLLGSVLNQPWASIQSIAGEVGLIGLCVLFLFFFGVLRKIRLGVVMFRENGVGHIYFVFFVYLIYIFIMLFIDNYLEFPRIIMPLYFYLGMLLIYVNNKKRKKAIEDSM